MGSVLMTAAVALLITLDRGTPVILAAAFVLLLGTGAGFAMQPSLLAAQNGVEHHDLGTATSTALLFRTLGNTIGTPIFGGILNARLAGTARTPDAVAGAFHIVFAGAVLVGLASIVISWFLPERALREHTHLETLDLAPWADEGRGPGRTEAAAVTRSPVPQRPHPELVSPDRPQDSSATQVWMVPPQTPDLCRQTVAVSAPRRMFGRSRARRHRPDPCGH